MTKWIVAGVAAAGMLAVGLPILLLASLTGMGAANATSACLSNLPQTTQPAIPGDPSAGQADWILSADQQTNAATIISVGQALVGPAGEVVAIDTAITESGLVDLPGGTGSSVGLFQQTSQWPGTVKQHMDPVWASTSFYQHLLAVTGWATMPVYAAAQKVQRSGAGQTSDGLSNYGPNVAEAQAIVAGTAAGPTLAAGLCPTTPLPGGLPAGVAQAISQAPVQVQTVIAFALSKLGDPYVWGATGPNAFDCSGLMVMSWRSADISIPRTTYQEVGVGIPVPSATALLPGDLVFPDAGHVVMYLGAGYIVEAPHTGDVVHVIPFYGMAGGARRLAQ